MSGSVPSSASNPLSEAAEYGFPLPQEYWEASHEDPDKLELFSRAPWFHISGFRMTSLLEEYTTADRFPDMIPSRAVDTREWALRCVVPAPQLNRRGINGHVTSLHLAKRAKFTRLMYSRLRRTYADELPICWDEDLDTWYFRTAGEQGYATRLSGILPRRTEWRGTDTFLQDALVLPCILRADFRFITRRRGQDPFVDCIRDERRNRSRTGYFVPYHMVEFEALTPAARNGRYLPLPSCWDEWETPQGWFVPELPAVLTYASTYLINNPDSGVWAIFFSELVARVGAALIWDCYDRFRLWWIPPRVREGLLTLNLDRVYGSRYNSEEVRSLVRVIGETNWDEVPKAQSARMTNPGNLSPSREHATAGDYIYYDPWKRETISPEEAGLLAAPDNHRVRPPGHRVGYGHSTTPDPSGLYPAGAPEGPEFLLEEVAATPEVGVSQPTPMDTGSNTQNTGEGNQ